MTSPYIRLSKAVINAKLTQNENLIFHALMMQTLGYRKSVDNLTNKRLAQLAGIRIDHFYPALESFLDHNLFYRIEHRDYDYQYRICDEFLDGAQTNIVYPPSLPQQTALQPANTASSNIGESAAPTLGALTDVRSDPPPTLGNLTEVGEENFPTLGDSPQLGGHTTENLYIKKQQQTETKKAVYEKKRQTKTKKIKKTIYKKQQQTKPKKIISEKKQQTKPKKIKTKKIISQQQPTVTIFMAGLDRLPEQFVIESSQPLRIEFSTKNIGQTTQKKDSDIRDSATLPKPVPEKKIEIPPEPVTTLPTCTASTPPIATPLSNDTHTETEAKIETKIEIEPPSTDTTTLSSLIATPTISQTTPLATTEKIEKTDVVVNEKEKVKKTLAIPKIVGEENYNACSRYFEVLNASQQKDVLTVFFYNLKVGKIRNKASYFIGLTQKAQTTNGLTIPHQATLKKSATLSPEQQAAKKKTSEEHAYRLDRWADYQWILRQSATQNKSEVDVAKSMGLEEALIMFGTPAALQQQAEEQQARAA